MKYLESLLFVLVPALVCFLGLTYIYNAEFGLFIIPEDPETDLDNVARAWQFALSVSFGVLSFANKEHIKNQVNNQ